MRILLVAVVVGCLVATSCSGSGTATPEVQPALEEPLQTTTTRSTELPATLPVPTSQVTTTTAPTDAATIVQDEFTGAVRFEGAAQLSEGQIGPVGVWIYLVEGGEPLGPRSLMGHAAVDEETWVATFAGVVPHELGLEGDRFTFEPFMSGDYEIVVSNHPHLEYEASRTQGPSIPVRIEIPPTAIAPVGDLTLPVDGELLTTGLAGANFGDGFDESYAKLVDRFGEPAMDSGWYLACEDPALRVIWWQMGDTYDEPVLQAEFNAELRVGVGRGGTELEPESVQDDFFASYRFGDTMVLDEPEFLGEVLSTPEGLVPGDSIQAVRNAYPAVDFYRIGDDTPGVNTWDSGDYRGRISSDPTDPEAVVGSIFAGRKDSGIPC